MIGASTRRWRCLVGFSESQASLRTAIPRRPSLERVPIKWNHLIDKDAAHDQRVGAPGGNQRRRRNCRLPGGVMAFRLAKHSFGIKPKYATLSAVKCACSKLRKVEKRAEQGICCVLQGTARRVSRSFLHRGCWEWLYSTLHFQVRILWVAIHLPDMSVYFQFPFSTRFTKTRRKRRVRSLPVETTTSSARLTALSKAVNAQKSRHQAAATSSEYC